MSQIFFVYDVSFCKAEEDDPKDAVVYFHPVHVCDTQRYALCCQLAGIAMFFKSSFTTPSVINLDRGKFAFYRSQNYILVLGGNSEVLDETLKLQLQCLFGTFRFYYRSIDDVLSLFEGERILFLKEMQKAWDQCLLVSQCFGSTIHLTFNAVPLASSSEMPSQIDKKNTSRISVKAKRLLQICQMNSGVLAGAVFCENLLLYSQMTPQLTKYLTLLLESHDLDFVNSQSVPTKLPPGVKLRTVYLTQTEVNSILKYNHQHAGSQFRYHCSKKVHSSSCANVNPSCGSEGDVDSENTDDDSRRVRTSTPVGNQDGEAVKIGHSSFSKAKAVESRLSFSPYGLHRAVCKGSSCSTCSNDSEYSSTLEATKWKRNFPVLKHKQQGQSVDVIRDTLYSNSVLLRRHHSLWCIGNSRTKWKDFDKTITHADDLKEFLDLDFMLSAKERDLCNSKCWSSDWEVRYMKKGLSPCLSPESCLLCHIKSNYIENEFCLNTQKKLQVLKCRSSKRNSKNIKANSKSCNCTSYLEYGDSSVFETREKSHYSSISHTSSFSKFDNCDIAKVNVAALGNADSEIQEMTLYIQRYGDCMLLFLLNEHFEEFHDHLWMYGSSVLGSLELDSKMYIQRHRKEKKPGFHIYVLNSTLGELTGKPNPINSSMEYRQSTDITMQMIHQSFSSDPSLCSISVMSRTKSIFGHNSPQYQIFYVEPGNSSFIKAEAKTHHDHSTVLSEKARRKIKKYFGITTNKM